MTRYLTAVSLAALIHASALAQDTTAPAPEAEAEAAAEATGWDVANPPLPTRDVTISVSEGTWMSLDVRRSGDADFIRPALGDPAALFARRLAHRVHFRPRRR